MPVKASFTFPGILQNAFAVGSLKYTLMIVSDYTHTKILPSTTNQVPLFLLLSETHG